MVSRVSTFCLVAANILIPIAILTFASGFFPYKPFLTGLAQYESLEYGPPPEAPFDKVIFMVVDALRSDFVFGEESGFQFTQSLIASGAAIPFTAHATSPTITMPRIKAITTGSTPSFLDVILNFAESDTSSTLATQDTWLAQLKAKGGGKMIMYGDDTWLKLFPDFFDRADGTSSFFVADFTEVDNNVTRHVPEELKNDDWNTMVLHYLGLDHIGHKAGPRSPNMIPKQTEMDGIVSQIHSAMETTEALESTLLILCGDHGMNDAGNHGGSAPGETSPALVFISPKLKTINSGSQTPAAFEEDFQYYSTVEQSDIAPTLGALLGFPVPQNNLGAFIPAFLHFWPNNNDKIQILWRNARQILNVVQATFPSFEGDGPSSDCERLSSDVEELACQWRIITKTRPRGDEQDQNIDGWVLLITKWLQKASELMSSTASNYDMSKLITGQVFAATGFVMASVAAGPTIFRSIKDSAPFLLITLLYGIMMFASSYVEEEHHFWYWATTAWLVLLWIKQKRKTSFGTLDSRLLDISSILILIVARIIRRWNQTGQKWAGEPDIARTFFFEHRMFFWSLVAITYLWILQVSATKSFPRFPRLGAGIVATALVTAAVSFKLAFTYEDSPELMPDLIKSFGSNDAGISLVTRARIIFLSLAAVLVYTILTSFSHSQKPNPTSSTIHTLLTLFLATQSRATNIPILLLFEIQLYLLSTRTLSLVEITTSSLLLQHTSFFAMGGSNAISSIDLSSAYNGVSGYNVLAVGILTFISNWTGPVFWSSGTILLLLKLRTPSKTNSPEPTPPPTKQPLKLQSKSGEKVEQNLGDTKRGERNIYHQYLALRTLFVTASLVAVMGACTALRTHLFIWTVFSPKYLYCMAWCLGQHLGVDVVLGAGVWVMGGWLV